jgi:hypothetical protein
MRALGSSLSSLSIKHRLSLLTASLLPGIILTSTGASCCGVKQSALAVGRERLLNLTQPLANLSQQSTRKQLSEVSTATNKAAVVAFLQSPSSVLQQFGSAQNPNGLQLELWSANNSYVHGHYPDLIARGTRQTRVNACVVRPADVLSLYGKLFSKAGSLRR